MQAQVVWSALVEFSSSTQERLCPGGVFPGSSGMPEGCAFSALLSSLTLFGRKADVACKGLKVVFVRRSVQLNYLGPVEEGCLFDALKGMIFSQRLD